ncbi:MAG TPA: hypothetical protein VGB99_18435 [Acidobacteriota bacterium]
MRAWGILLACAALSLCAPSAAAETGLLKGVVLGLFSADPGADYGPALRELYELGAEAVSLMVVSTMPDVHSVEITTNPWGGSSDERIRITIQQAHALGLRVHLIPTLHVVDVAPGRWRGTLEPPSWEAWFAAYGAVLLRYAELAEQAGAEYFSVGSELISSEVEERRWRALIDQVRARYRGRLSYTCNWDALDGMRFADALDLLGANAYHEIDPLTNGGRPALPALIASWEPIRERLRAWSERHGRRVLITEIGYPSMEGGLRQPWNYLAGLPVDLEEQRLGYQAFLAAWAEADFLAGVFFYDWWGAGGPSDTSYTPRGKPAMELLRCWFADLATDGNGMLE